MKILVVDDERTSRQLLRELFLAEGYDVVLAEDGEEGIAQLEAEQPSLVISDILMPRVDGFQLLRKIRESSTLKEIPVIFFTGTYLDKKDEEFANEIGVSRYLMKPASPSELISVVNEVLAEDKKSRQSRSSLPSLEEPIFLKLYNERLVNKLKGKVVESERARLSLEHIMEGIGDGVIVIDREYTILHANSAVAASLVFEKEDLIGKTCYEIIHNREAPCEGPEVVCHLPAVFDKGETVKVLHTHVDAEGRERHIEITAAPVKDSRGDTFAMVETHRDIMEKQRDDELVKLVKKLNEAQTHLKYMAITDELTGLKNRRYIVERLDEEFHRAKRPNRPLSLIMLDIDHFKKINDVHGHLFGDMVLKTIASRIKESLRKHDLVGRVGGEEFLVICPESGLDESVLVAERIRRIVNAKAISDGMAEVSVTLSAGVAVIDQEDKRADALLSRADTALYKAKEAGRNRVVTLPR